MSNIWGSYQQKLKTLLKELEYNEDPTLEYVFNKELCQKVMKYYWQKIVEDKYRFLFDHDKKPQKMLQEIIMKLDVKPKQALYLLGLKILCKDADGISGLRVCMQNKCPPRTWQRITKDFETLSAMTKERDTQEWLQQIDEEIINFNPYKLIKKYGNSYGVY